jgi:hypothetical protein
MCNTRQSNHLRITIRLTYLERGKKDICSLVWTDHQHHRTQDRSPDYLPFRRWFDRSIVNDPLFTKTKRRLLFEASSLSR